MADQIEPLSARERTIVFVGAVLAGAILGVVAIALISPPVGASTAATISTGLFALADARPDLARRILEGADDQGDDADAEGA